MFYLQPLLSLLFALHSQHESVCPLVDNLQFVLLLLAIFGDVGDAAPGQSQLHLRGVVFGRLVALRGRMKEAAEWPDMMRWPYWCLTVYEGRCGCVFHVISYQQFVVLDDAEQLGPLAEALLAQQERTDPRILDQIHGRLF